MLSSGVVHLRISCNFRNLIFVYNEGLVQAMIYPMMKALRKPKDIPKAMSEKFAGQ